MLRNRNILKKSNERSVTRYDVKNNLMHFLGFLIILYIAYYIDSLQAQNAEQQQIIKSQGELINLQTIYINEVNDLLNIEQKHNSINRHNSPINRGPI